MYLQYKPHPIIRPLPDDRFIQIKHSKHYYERILVCAVACIYRYIIKTSSYHHPSPSRHGCGFSGSALFKVQDGNSAMQCSAVIQREVIDSAHRTQSIFFQLGMFRHVAPAELTKAPQVTTNSKVDNLFIVFCVKRECCMWSSSLCSLSITRVAAMITRHPFTFFHSFCLIYYDIIITTSKRTAYILYFYYHDYYINHIIIYII